MPFPSLCCFVHVSFFLPGRRDLIIGCLLKLLHISSSHLDATSLFVTKCWFGQGAYGRAENGLRPNLHSCCLNTLPGRTFEFRFSREAFHI